MPALLPNSLPSRKATPSQANWIPDQVGPRFGAVSSPGDDNNDILNVPAASTPGDDARIWLVRINKNMKRMAEDETYRLEIAKRLS